MWGLEYCQNSDEDVITGGCSSRPKSDNSCQRAVQGIWLVQSMPYCSCHLGGVMPAPSTGDSREHSEPVDQALLDKLVCAARHPTGSRTTVNNQAFPLRFDANEA